MLGVLQVQFPGLAQSSKLEEGTVLYIPGTGQRVGNEATATENEGAANMDTDMGEALKLAPNDSAPPSTTQLEEQKESYAEVAEAHDVCHSAGHQTIEEDVADAADPAAPPTADNGDDPAALAAPAAPAAAMLDTEAEHSAPVSTIESLEAPGTAAGVIT